MGTKADRIEARLSAAERADEVLAASMVTATPVDLFDRFLAALDQPDDVARTPHPPAIAASNSCFDNSAAIDCGINPAATTARTIPSGAGGGW